MRISTLPALAFCAAFATSGLAYGQQLPHAPHKGCSVGLQDGALIKDRMLRQRAAYPNIGRNMLPTYVPVAVTSVASNSGVGHANVNEVLAMMCDLNADYADQNVFFYLKDSIRYRQNDSMYNDAGSSVSDDYMHQNKVPNALNIYLSNTVQNAVASFYAPWNDYVFIITSEADGTSNTATHEVGHFFSLAHTFYGWEGIAYHDNYQGQNAPTSIRGHVVERFARTGSGSNCASAADGFCDTPADYISDRWPCPYVGVQGVLAKDPTGVDIDPMEENFMSYFADACVTTFTTQQKAAILADLQSRGWSNLAIPTPNASLTGTDVVALSPINSQVVLADGTSNITLQWQALQNASMYVVTLERLLLGQPVGTIFTVLVPAGRTSYTFSSSMMPLPPANGTSDYRWQVKPLNSVYTCAAYSNEFLFKASRTGTPSSVEVQSNSNASLMVSPNPVENGSVQLRIEANKAHNANLRIYAPDGKLVVEQRNFVLSEGTNTVALEAAHLSAGLYVVVLTDEKGANLVSRFVVR